MSSYLRIEGISLCVLKWNITDVTIPEGVTSIGASAFEICSGLTSVTVEGVVSIGFWAFMGCGAMTSITFPERMTFIGEEAFSKCRSLTSITIPEGVQQIPYRAFWMCASLESITFPKSLTSIQREVFVDCPIKTFQYCGTVAEWKANVTCSSDMAKCKITCTDGIFAREEE